MRKLSLAVALLAAGCSRQEASHPAAAPSAPIAVKTVTVVSREIADAYRASGTVRARYTAAVAARIAGQIESIQVQVGDHVRPGELLVRIDSRDLQANLRRAEAGQSEAKNAIAEAESATAAARASLDLARVTHRRFEDLLAKKSVSQQEYDESAARLKGAEAAVQMSLSKRQQVEARMAQAAAEVEAARVMLGFATLAAPLEGTVVERRADPGSMATPGMPLLLIEQAGLRLEAPVAESRLGTVKTGQTVEVELEGLSRTVSGRVAEIVPAVDAATRTFMVKIDLPATTGLRAGTFGRAAFAGGRRQALLVPQAAVVERGQIQGVYVVEGETARLRLVSLGEARGEEREILAGLSGGEKVVVGPPAGLADGGRVK